jgi:hypothetical protein
MDVTYRDSVVKNLASFAGIWRKPSGLIVKTTSRKVTFGDDTSYLGVYQNCSAIIYKPPMGDR